MVLEALSYGRHVLYSYPLPGVAQVAGTEQAIAELLRLKALHDAGELPLNHAGIEAVSRTYARDVVREELRQRWKEIILA